MGWEDRQYGSDRGRSVGGVLRWLLGGSFPIGSFAGIRIRVHAMLPVLAALVIVFDRGHGFELRTRVISMAILFVSVLLHEFGHCFAARAVGGEADEILLWPLGGLATAQTPQRPWPMAVMVMAGPAVNFAICGICVAAIYYLGGGSRSLFNPFNAQSPFYANQVGHYFFWVFFINYALFLFNLLPIYPLDGGNLLKAALWNPLGSYRAARMTYIIGMIGSGVLSLFGLLSGSWIMLTVALSCLLLCYQHYVINREMGPEEWAGEFGGAGGGVDYSASLKLRPEDDDPPASKRKRRVSRWKVRRLRKLALREDLEQQRIDAILAKVSAQGMHSLTWGERRALKRATERQRRRELELSK